MKHCEECGTCGPRYIVSIDINYGIFLRNNLIEKVCKNCLGEIVSLYSTPKRPITIRMETEVK
jgi:hypothetical protein